MAAAKKKGPRKQVETSPEEFEWTEAAGDYFKHTITFPERVDPDERSAIGTLALETTDQFPSTKQASNIAVLIALDGLPADGTVTIGPQGGPFKGHGEDSFLKVEVGGTLKYKYNPDGSDRPEKDWKTSVALEIKTGVFAALELHSVGNSDFCVKKSDLAKYPEAATKHGPIDLTLEVRYDLSEPTVLVIGTQEIDESIEFSVED